MLSYEHEAIYQRIESQYIFEELAKENDNLKRLLLINHEFNESIEDRIKEIEKAEISRKLENDELRFPDMRENENKNVTDK